jgi:excinuclease ABC subunit A
MDFLADLWVTCPVCEGKRYNHETLQVKFKDKSIADVLEMDIQQALELFENVPKIADKLQHLARCRARLHQARSALTDALGGEAQRIKLAKELSRQQHWKHAVSARRTDYRLCTSTTSALLLKVLQDLVDLGNTVLVIEHNLDVIRAADWLIDIGAEGGEAGGDVVFVGTPDEIVNCQAIVYGSRISQAHRRFTH